MCRGGFAANGTDGCGRSAGLRHGALVEQQRNKGTKFFFCLVAWLLGCKKRSSFEPCRRPAFQFRLQPLGGHARDVGRKRGIEMQRGAPGQRERAATKFQRARAGEQVQGSMFRVQCSEFDVCLSETNGTSNIQRSPVFAALRLGKTSNAEHSIGSFLRRNHSTFPRVIEQTAGVHDRADVAERFEFISLAAVHG